MSATPRKRLPPAQRFAGSQHLLDLTAAAEALRREGEPARDGHRQITLFHEGGLSVILFDFEAGGRLADHAADGLVTIQTLDGAVDVTTSSRTHALPAGSLLVLEPGLAHDVEARVASRMLLTVHMPHS